MQMFASAWEFEKKRVQESFGVVKCAIFSRGGGGRSWYISLACEQAKNAKHV